MRPTVQICHFSSHFSWRFVLSWSRVERLYSRLNYWHACEGSVYVHDGAATLPSWSSNPTREEQLLHWIEAQFFMLSPYHLSSTAFVPQMCVWVFGFGFYQRVLQVECHNKRMVPATAMSGVTCLHREIWFLGQASSGCEHCLMDTALRLMLPHNTLRRLCVCTLEATVWRCQGCSQM